MAKSLKLPKRIAGVKLPRKARKTANKAIKVGANPVVRELAVAAIGAAGGKAMGDNKAPKAEAEGSNGRAQAELDFAKVGEAFRTAAIDGLRRFLEGFDKHLSEACLGSISEIFDAEPPYHPRGCCAQAWSVAEVLRAWVKTAG